MPIVPLRFIVIAAAGALTVTWLVRHRRKPLPPVQRSQFPMRVMTLGS